MHKNWQVKRRNS